MVPACARRGAARRDHHQRLSGSSRVFAAVRRARRRLSYFNGTADQAPWASLESEWPADAFGYQSTAYLGAADFPLDSTATIPQFNFLVQAVFAGTSPLNPIEYATGKTFVDADPALVIVDFLTNAQYGSGFPPALIDPGILSGANATNPAIGDAALQTYCQAVGLAFTTFLSSAEPASSVLERWCKLLSVAPVWTGQTLKFIPYFDTFSGANPGWDADAGLPEKYYQPDLSQHGSVRFYRRPDHSVVSVAKTRSPTSENDIKEVFNTVRLDFRARFEHRIER